MAACSPEWRSANENQGMPEEELQEEEGEEGERKKERKRERKKTKKEKGDGEGRADVIHKRLVPQTPFQASENKPNRVEMRRGGHRMSSGKPQDLCSEKKYCTLHPTQERNS